MIEFDEHGIATNESGHQELHPFHPEHLDKPEYNYLRPRWAQAHPEEMVQLGAQGLDKGE